jgi:hypothetical protein
VANYADVETMSLGFCHAFNEQRQRVPGGISPTTKVNERLAHQPNLANRRYRQPTDQNIMHAVDSIMTCADDVSQRDN